jgi:hypothetical protein
MYIEGTHQHLSIIERDCLKRMEVGLEIILKCNVSACFYLCIEVATILYI